jgi:hypothetical protein
LAAVEDPSKLKAVVKDPLGNVVLSYFQSDGDSDGHLKFAPKLPGGYTAELFNGPTKIAEIPLDVHPSEATPNFHANAPVSYPVPLESIPFSGKPSNLKLAVTNPAGKEIPSIITVDPTDATLQFAPKAPGTYKAACV